MIGGDAFFTSHSEQLAALAISHAVPAVYQWRQFAAAGGLMSYGSNITETHRLAGALAGRILKGDKPADLPVQQATKVELFINLKTAKTLGVTFPPSLLGRADEVFDRVVVCCGASVRCWHKADIRGTATIWSLLDKSGRFALAHLRG